MNLVDLLNKLKLSANQNVLIQIDYVMKQLESPPIIDEKSVTSEENIEAKENESSIIYYKKLN